MPPHESVWGSINTCFEIGLELYRLTAKNGSTKAVNKAVTVEKLTEDVLLISNDKEILIAVGTDTAQKVLSEAAVSHGIEKGDYRCYPGATAAIPMFELARINTCVRDYIVNDESLRATLCCSYPEYVKTHNMSAAPDAQIKDADAPPYLFLQKQLDNAADETRSEVAAFWEAHVREIEAERGLPDDVLELER
jgi:hypothetical protein